MSAIDTVSGNTSSMRRSLATPMSAAQKAAPSLAVDSGMPTLLQALPLPVEKNCFPPEVAEMKTEGLSTPTTILRKEAKQLLKTAIRLQLAKESDGQSPPAVRAFHFNINGYVADFMYWRQFRDGRVELLAPMGDSEKPTIAYASLAAMKEGIRDLLATPKGRAMIERHFDMPQCTWAWGWNLSTWLDEIPRHFASYKYAIADYYHTEIHLS